MDVNDAQKLVISYCIPVMNRLNDIKNTLEHNLNVIRKFKNEVEIVVVNFDSDDVCDEWIKNNFSIAIQEGFLKYSRKNNLPFWHFSLAKNSFKELIDSQYYSSLDGDNFLSEAEVFNTLELVKNRDVNYVIHYFSGKWGDGTSGRVTVPTKLYKKYGYINEIFPRQFDEFGLILNVFSHENNCVFVARKGVDIRRLSLGVDDFCRLNEINLNPIGVDFGPVNVPLNPKGAGYNKKDNVLSSFQAINQNYTLLKLSKTEDAKDYFSIKLKETQNSLVHDDVLNYLLCFLFDFSDLPALEKSNVLTVYSVIKDDPDFLDCWYEHYKKLGVKRFIIVDDNSIIPIENVLNYSDVHVVRPRVGDFRSFKVFWLMALMKIYQDYDSWILTVDSDEFVDVLHKGVSDIPCLLNKSVSNDKLLFPGLLIEMMPNDNVSEINSSNYIDVMNTVYVRPVNDKYGYQNLAPVKWAFGEKWSLSFSFDLRWRFFGTHDCLRKFPIIKYVDGIILHQGFHSIYYRGNECKLDNIDGLLLIKHYKMYKFFSSNYNVKAYKKSFDSYFSRTKNNLKKIFSTNKGDILAAWKVTPFKYPYSTLVSKFDDFIGRV